MRRGSWQAPHSSPGCNGSAVGVTFRWIAKSLCVGRAGSIKGAGGISPRWSVSRAILIAGRGKCLMDVQEIRAITEAVRGEVRKAVVGQDEVIDLMLTSLLVGGHILLEGVPGTAKTMITRAFGAGLDRKSTTSELQSLRHLVCRLLL